jgi:hypothetical protein
VAGRAQAFSDPRVIDLLTDEFVAVAENSSSLEREQTDKGEFFRHIAEQGHYGGRTFPTTTRQGSYTFTAQGQFLASVNTREAVGMEGMLRTGLDRWRAGYSLGGPAPTQLAPEATEDDGYPIGGLVLEVAARDLPRETDTRPEDWRKIAWNLDYAWITRDEARDLVPESRAVGAHRDFPDPIVRRLARFHLRDFVRGEPVAWLPEALRSGQITAEIVAVDGDQVRLTLSGAVHLENDTVWTRPEDGVERRYPTGYRCTLQGEAIWDESRGAFIQFDLVAVGDRWGANQYNNREDDLGPAPQGIAFTLAGDAPSDHTPPHCIRTWRRAREGVRPSRVVVTTEQYYQPE